MGKFVVAHLLINSGGGLLSVVRDLVLYQNNNNMLPIIVCPDNCYEKISQNLNGLDVKIIKVQKLPQFRGGRSLFGFPIIRIVHHLKNLYPDTKIIIHAHSLSSIGMFNSIFNKRHIQLCTVHGIIINNNIISNLIQRIIVFFINFSDMKIIGVSKTTSEYLEHSLKIKSKNIITIMNGASVSRKIAPEVSNNNFIFGFLGDVNYNKGWHLVLESFEELCNHYNNIFLYFVGEGPELQELKKNVETSPYKDKIKVYGYVTEPEKTILKSFNILVLPSISEGLPISIIEAMGNSIPSIASKVGGIPEIITDGVNGYLLDFIVSKEIVKKSEIILNDIKRYSIVRNNCNKYFSEKLNYTIMGKNYYALYLEYL